VLSQETQSTARRRPRANRRVVLVGFQKQGNLGLGYLSAVLRRNDFDVTVVDIELELEDIVAAIRRADPVLVGFSLIFQFYIRRYADLMQGLRDAGVDCHFTMGGHYPSLAYEQTLAAAPQLDSVVRFEGEATLLEMVEALSAGEDWREIQGVVWKNGRELVANPPRHLTPDLDSLPFPDREFDPFVIIGRKGMPLLASRGCARTCSFCSIHTFYRTAPGKVVRLRKPAEVVREMKMLFEQKGITIFLFQDDDFPMFGPKWRAWSHQLVDEIEAAGLARRVVWKLNCRADAVEPELLGRMRDAGLYCIYMGLESGTEEGLKVLNKEITVAQNLAAVAMLKELNIRFDFGFMLLDPSSTFESVLANIGFLRQIVGDGSASATFCKMLPYDGTPIKDALMAEGRLKGDVVAPDYDFLDPRLDRFYAGLARVMDVTGWVHGPHALNMQLNFAHHEVAVIRKLYPELPDTDEYEAWLRHETALSNEVLFDTVERLVAHYRDGTAAAPDAAALDRIGQETLKRVVAGRDAFILRNQQTLLAALQIAA
jgi:anaerobic magnesium-protoporphyrin IX monomethyl ester cyclase